MEADLQRVCVTESAGRVGLLLRAVRGEEELDPAEAQAVLQGRTGLLRVLRELHEHATRACAR